MAARTAEICRKNDEKRRKKNVGKTRRKPAAPIAGNPAGSGRTWPVWRPELQVRQGTPSGTGWRCRKRRNMAGRRRIRRSNVKKRSGNAGTVTGKKDVNFDVPRSVFSKFQSPKSQCSAIGVPCNPKAANLKTT